MRPKCLIIGLETRKISISLSSPIAFGVITPTEGRKVQIGHGSHWILQERDNTNNPSPPKWVIDRDSQR
eukprot:5765157-Pleurochrysis_carterae.AAC.2